MESQIGGSLQSPTIKIPAGGAIKLIKIVGPFRSKNVKPVSKVNAKREITLAECVDLNCDSNSNNEDDQSSLTSDKVFESPLRSEDGRSCVGKANLSQINHSYLTELNLSEAKFVRLKTRFNETKKDNRNLRLQVNRLKNKIKSLKEKKTNMKLSKGHALQYINENLNGVKRAFVLAQIEDHVLPNGRRWTQEMLQFAALFYNQNKQSYNTLANYLAMPSKKTLIRAIHKANNPKYAEEEFTKQLAEQMKIKRNVTGEIVEDEDLESQTRLNSDFNDMADSLSENLEVDESSVNSDG